MLRKALLAGLLLLLVPSLVLAQADLTGRVSGTVTDEEGNGIAGARIELISPAMQGDRVLKTDDNGKYLVGLLPVGAYAMTISAPNMQSLTYSFRVQVGQTQPLDVTLKAGEELVEEVTVYGTATALETTTVGENFSYDTAVEGLPVQNRNIEAVASLAPNVGFGPTPGTLAISGAPSFDTVVLLDGAEISDPYFGSAPTVFLTDAIEEVQVMTSGVSARYGRFQGGVINAITKSGGNTFDGTIRAEFDNEDWDSTTPFDETTTDELNKVYQGTVGGYIMKDRLWFFGGMRYIPDTATSGTTRGTSEAYVTNSSEDRWQLKLRGAINPNHIVELSHLDKTRDITGRAGLPAYDLFAATGTRADPQETTTLSYQGVVTSSMFVEFLYTEKSVSIQSGGDPANGDPFLYAGNALPGWGLFHNHWWDFNDASVRDNETYGLSATQVLSAGDWGDHTLEYGVQFVESTTGGENRQSSTGYNLLFYDIAAGFYGVDMSGPEPTFSMETFFGNYNQIAYRWDALPLGGTQAVESAAIFLQDTWQIDKWRFDVGLRYDDWSGSGPLPTMDLSFTSFVPRLGVTYNIDDNWQLQATFGQYSSRFNDSVAGNVTGVSSAPRIETIYTGAPMTGLSYDDLQNVLRDDANWGFTSAVYDPSQPTVLLADGIEAPTASDFNLSVKRALPRNSGSFTLTYSRRDFNNLLDDFVGDNGTVDVFDPNNPGDLIGTFDLSLWDNSDVATREYEAVTATWDFRPGVRWNIGGNYTYSQTRGNYEGEGRNTPSSGSRIGDYERSYPFEAAVPYGFLDEDLTHRFISWGNYRFDFDKAGGLNLGAIFKYQSGDVWSRTASVPLNNDPDYISDIGNYTHYFDGRGNNRFNGSWRLDFSARYTFPIFREDVSGWLKIDALNVLDQDELTSYGTTGFADDNGAGTLAWNPSGSCGPGDSPSVDCSSFGRISSQGNYQTPRTMLLTLGVQF
ncbi:MAG: TonB-dependent receptor [Acidobacteria bacterium]|uniref:TonB-dependent receptor n=1 Tax=Candidatus Polarisedimenticola svalbardensis TaxID=2886004 RepID=A0A8J7CDY1_9BACT|nr:TonB-dependent receptor [Candidatus Polarisedimenticola svalbardensis]